MEKSLIRLVSRETIEGRTFLDIGCGSGLFSLAEARLGFRQLLAVDLNPKSVEITADFVNSPDSFKLGMPKRECL